MGNIKKPSFWDVIMIEAIVFAGSGLILWWAIREYDIIFLLFIYSMGNISGWWRYVKEEK